MNYLIFALFFLNIINYIIPILTCESLTLASYNIHGLPRIITLDDTYTRMKEIANVFNNYNFDIINIQEDWTTYGNNILINNLPEYIWQQRLNKYIHKYSIFGSGLLQLSKITPTNQSQIVFNTRYGYDDMWANKGFQVIRLGYLDIYNTHMDAGRTSGDKNARLKETMQLIDYINKWSYNRAIIIGGDTNLRSSDNTSYNLLMNSLNLTEITNKTSIDKFLYRNSSDQTITPISVYSIKNNTLSDHNMIYIDVLIC